MKKLILLIVITIITSKIGLAQTAPVKEWDKTFGGNDEDYLISIQQTLNGGYVLGGYSSSGISGNKTGALKGGSDFWVIKIDALGNKLWDKSYGGNSTEQLTSILQTADGGYIVGGISASQISGDKSENPKGGLIPPSNYSGYLDFWLIKLDSIGNIVWDKTLGGDGDDNLASMQQTSDGGYILGGYSNSGIGFDKSEASKGNRDYWILKLDANGNKLWDRTFGGNNNDYLSSVRQTSDGGFILGGESNSGISADKSQPSKGKYDYWILKLDANGFKIWDKTFGGSEEDYLEYVQQSPDGSYFLGGSSSSPVSSDKSQPPYLSQFITGAHDFWILKLNANGTKIWDKTLGGNDSDRPGRLEVTNDGGCVLLGHSFSGISSSKSDPLKGMHDLWLVKLDGNGNKLWDRSLGGIGQDGNGEDALRFTSDGSYIVGGYSNSPISGDKSEDPVIRFNGSKTIDFWVVKLSVDITGISETKTDFNVTVFPNPNSGSFNLHLNELNSPKVEIMAINLLGQKVFEQELKVLNNQISLEVILPVPKGMYLLQLKTGNQIITRKIVVE